MADRTNAEITRWAVTWTTILPGGERTGAVTNCALATGQTDDLTSIRKMIAIRRGLNWEDIKIHAMSALDDEII